MVPRGDRTGVVIEPFLTDQWYVRVEPLAKPAIAAVENGDIKFVPDNWKNTYFEWMRNIQDWCISRQIWWGHRIPAWYDEAGNTYVGRSEQAIRARHNLPKIIRCARTKMSSIPGFHRLCGPSRLWAGRMKRPSWAVIIRPASWSPASTIIFFWVARMIMMGLKFKGDVPFREVYIHGLVRDAEGQKMSKSKGNVLDRSILSTASISKGLVQKRISGMMQPHLAKKIEQSTRKQFPEGIPSYGNRCAAFHLCIAGFDGAGHRFDLARTEGYRNFCNKLWNAARFRADEHRGAGQRSVRRRLQAHAGGPLDRGPA